jgi:hypothetical protein
MLRPIRNGQKMKEVGGNIGDILARKMETTYSQRFFPSNKGFLARFR